ncbi:MAG: HypC/HybG/HupF family hydrogenase formation chaperone [Patescibacteria group bacterium]
MCLAIPGKIIELNGQQATVKYPSEERKVLTGGEELKVGDYVMVQMGIIVKVISEKEAKVSEKAWLGEK